MLIKSNAELKEYIAGKRVLHLNSFGKDATAALVWLSQAPVEVVSLNFRFLVEHPADKPYLDYLSKTFPHVNFVREPYTQELNKIAKGIYQSPIEKICEINTWPHEEFSFDLMIEEMKAKYQCDYICVGMSKYESVTRAQGFYKKGLLQDDRIFPLGLLDKKQVLSLAKVIKLHPCYKLAKSTYDFPTYWKMRSAFIVYPEYYERMKQFFPLIELDKYRYEKMMEFRSKNETE